MKNNQEKIPASSTQSVVDDDEMVTVFFLKEPRFHTNRDFINERTIPEGVVLLWCSNMSMQCYPCKHWVRVENEPDGTVRETCLDCSSNQSKKI